MFTNTALYNFYVNTNVCTHTHAHAHVHTDEVAEETQIPAKDAAEDIQAGTYAYGMRMYI